MCAWWQSIYLFNHLRFTILYNDFHGGDKRRVVGFEVEPISVKHTYDNMVSVRAGGREGGKERGRGGEEGRMEKGHKHRRTRTHQRARMNTCLPLIQKKKQVDWDGCVNEVSGGKCKLNTCDTAHQVSPKAHIRKSTL